MATRIEERFTVRAEPRAVFEFLVDPRRVVGCLPGAELVEVVDDRTFLGNVKVKVGPVTVSYKGKVTLVERDDAARRVRMSGEGREAGGAGSARMTMESEVAAGEGGGAEVLVRSDVDIAGRLVQLGRGMIEQVSHQIFLQFAENVRGTLEAEAVPGGQAAPSGKRPEAVAALPLLLRALWAWLKSLFGRTSGGTAR